MKFVAIPRKVFVGTASSEGETELNAFDNCLLKLGIGDVSLVKITSILPNDVEIVDDIEELPEGMNVPAIYTYKISNRPNAVIAAAIAIGKTDKGPTLVAEFSAEGVNAEEAEDEATKRLYLMAKARKLKLITTEVYSIDHRVEKLGCVLAAVVELE